jgi:arsenite methyltransferase
MALVAGCIGGASSIVEVGALLRAAGFKDIRISPVEESKSFMRDWAPGMPVTDYLVSASIEAIKPST